VFQANVMFSLQSGFQDAFCSSSESPTRRETALGRSLTALKISNNRYIPSQPQKDARTCKASLCTTCCNKAVLPLRSWRVASQRCQEILITLPFSLLS